MKKLVSLLLAVMLVMSMMTFNVMASSDTEVLPTSSAKYENALAVGGSTVTTTNTNGYRTNSSGVVVVAMEDETDATNTNKIFKVNASAGTQQSTSKTIGLILGGTGQLADTAVQRFSAKINLPSVTAGITEAFLPINAFNATYKTTKTVGVTLKNGGAQYYDAASNNFVNFIANGTMEANHWYLIEVIQDTRIDSPTTKARYAYMNAFVYDAENGNSLVGTSGWQYVGEAKVYADTNYGPIGSLIQAYSYPAVDESTPAYVLVDEFKAYKVQNIPTYTMESASQADANSYVSSDSSGSYRVLATPFNGNGNGNVVTNTEYSNGNVLYDPSETRAARIEMDVRFPSLATDDEFDIFSFYHGQGGGTQGPGIYSNKTSIFEGTVNIASTALTVKSYNATTGLYDTPVTLEGGGASYTIEADKWYTLVWDIDHTDPEAPVGMLYVKDAEGTVLAKAASQYAIEPMPQNTNGQNINLLMYIASFLKDRVYNVDNTNIYKAVAMKDLESVSTREVVFEDDFESYEAGANYVELVQGRQGMAKPASYWDTAAVITEDPVDFSAPLPSTDPVAFTFTYSNPVPASVLTTNNIELYADGIKMSTGYTITPGTLDANNCTTTFTVATGVLDWGTDYVIRVKAAVVDYNTALSGGVPAEPGLYKDIAFSVADLTPDCTIAGEFVEGAGTVGAKVTFNSNEDSPLTCYAILAVYEGNKLVGLKKSAEITVPANAENYEAAVEATALPAGAKAKIFVWNNFETMRPWVSPIVLGE